MIRHRSSQSPIIRPGFSRERATPAASEAAFSSPLDFDPFAWYWAGDLVGIYNDADPLTDPTGWPSHLDGADTLSIVGDAPSYLESSGPVSTPAVYFDGISQYLLWTEYVASGPKTFFFVIDPDDVTATRTMFYSTTGLLTFGHEGATGNTFYNYGGGGKVCGAKSDVPQILVFSMNSTTQIARRNGSNLTITSPAWVDVAVGGLTYLGVGVSAGTAFFSGLISEVIAYNSALSAEEIEQVETWLNTEHGYGLF